MRIKFENNGSALMVTVFAVAVLAVLTIGILQINTEELQIARNQIYATQALATAEAGLNDAFVQFRADPNWMSGFVNKAFADDTYTVTVAGTFPTFTVTSTGVTAQGYTARMSADLTMGTQQPYVVRIDELRINE
jgi:Tfp pilus assembly protein PilX